VALTVAVIVFVLILAPPEVSIVGIFHTPVPELYVPKPASLT